MDQISNSDPKREMLRHTLATLDYRCSNALSNAPAGFEQYRAGDTTRTPVEILAHIGDLFDWALRLAKGEHKWQDSKPLPWEQEIERFETSVRLFDAYLASEAPLLSPPERLFQGPIADAHTHVGQIAMLRRMAGSPIKSENYFKANIAVGSGDPA